MLIRSILIFGMLMRIVLNMLRIYCEYFCEYF